VGGAAAGAGELGDLLVVDMDGVGEPTSSPSQPSVSIQSTGRSWKRSSV
jgi:hypothetical protein